MHPLSLDCAYGGCVSNTGVL